jgi:hypothetical protein
MTLHITSSRALGFCCSRVLPEKTQELLAKVLKKADAIERKAPEASTMIRGSKAD